MARNQPAWVNWSQYLAARGAATLVHSFPLEQNLRTASTLGRMYYRLSAMRRNRCETNIRLSFPDWDDTRIQNTARKSLQYMFQIFLVEALASPRLINTHTWSQYIELGNIGAALDRLLRKEAAILISGHCGNWELLGQTLGALGYPPAALARPIDNPLINRWLLGQRESSGMRVITKWGATPEIQQTLRNNGLIAFIADQNAGDQGLFVPFFGRLASSYKSIGLMAMRYKVPIIAGTASRVGEGFRYQITVTDIIDPQDWADRPDPLYYITARYNRAMEQMIRVAPWQYLWAHRRWRSRPRHERQGKPIPHSLIAKMEALPWMTDEELKRIIHNSNHGIGGAK